MSSSRVKGLQSPLAQSCLSRQFTYSTCKSQGFVAYHPYLSNILPMSKKKKNNWSPKPAVRVLIPLPPSWCGCPVSHMREQGSLSSPDAAGSASKTFWTI